MVGPLRVEAKERGPEESLVNHSTSGFITILRPTVSPACEPEKGGAARSADAAILILYVLA